MNVGVRILLLGSLCVAAATAGTLPFMNEDLFLGLASGRATLNGSLGLPDQWSFTMRGRVWVDQSWLSHLIYYLSYLILEDLGPVLTKAALLIASLALLFVQCRSLGVSPEISLFTTALGTLSLAPFLNIRAQNFGMVYFVLMAYILTLPSSWGRWRHFGALAVLLIWSNSHGSFMLGFFLIGLRFGVDVLYGIQASLYPTLPRVEKREISAEYGVVGQTTYGERVDEYAPDGQERQPDIWGWSAVLVFSAAVIAFCNPYGPENLLIPFRQLFATSVTARWVDWRPLIDMQTMFKRGYFAAFSVLPFLSLVLLTGILGAVLVCSKGLKESLGVVLNRPSHSDALMTVLLPIAFAPLVFKFQRMIVFEAPAMVPLLALLMHVNGERALERFSWIKEWIAGRVGVATAFLACLVWLSLTGILFYKSIIECYRAGNPLNPILHERPLSEELMSYSLSRKDAVRFLKDNGITGRIFTNEFLSGYLLFQVPDITLLFDLRAQSFYPDTLVDAYAAIIGATPESVHRALRLLKSFQVSTVVVDTTIRRYFWLANMLMASQEWACIYRDEWVMVLARSDSKRFGRMIRKGNLDQLLFHRQETRTVTHAFLAQFMTGAIPPQLMNDLKAILRAQPDPNIYSLIATSGMNRATGCLDPSTVAFLVSEARRLSEQDYLVVGGAIRFIESGIRILFILEANEITCGTQEMAGKYRGKRKQLERLLDRIRDRYGDF